MPEQLLIVNTIVWEQAKRLRSYELLAAEFGLDAALSGEGSGLDVFSS
jgi:hypothetical protein